MAIFYAGLNKSFKSSLTDPVKVIRKGKLFERIGRKAANLKPKRQRSSGSRNYKERINAPDLSRSGFLFGD